MQTGGKMVTINADFDQYVAGAPCDHPGCANHITHPCEQCGRIAAGAGSRTALIRDKNENNNS